MTDAFADANANVIGSRGSGPKQKSMKNFKTKKSKGMLFPKKNRMLTESSRQVHLPVMPACTKSADGRHNFSVPGADCAHGCGVNQNDISGRKPKKMFESIFK